MRRQSFTTRAVLLCLAALFLLAAIAGLTGCSKQPVPSPVPPHANRGIPYTVDGITYYPLISAEGYAERGVASWYGPGFHGRTTSSGEKYDMYAATAAHRVLPFGSLVRVTNLSNEKKTMVRINDRGPFKGNRIIDLSYKGAQEIAMIGPGTAPVKIEVVGIDRTYAVNGKEIRIPWANNFAIQVGAFGSKQNALNLKEKISSCYHQKVYVVSSVQGSTPLYRVRVGIYNSLKETMRVQEQLYSAGYTSTFMVAE